MVWESTVIERDALYREVWAQPMTVLAKKYGISDVAADSQEGCAGEEREPLTMGEAICLVGIWTLSGVAAVSVVAYFFRVFA